MNKIYLIGRLTAEPEIKNSGNTEYAKYSLAVDRKFKRDGGATADFFNCTAFGKSAEFVEKYLHKGMKIAVIGRMESSDYTNRDGQKVRSWGVMVEEHEFCESKGNNQGNYSNQSRQANQNSGDGFVNVPDVADDRDELPFN